MGAGRSMAQGKEEPSAQETQPAGVIATDASTMSLGKGSGPAPVVLPTAPNACAGLELGPVRLIAEIGRGGMGAVYRGHHKMLGRDVAVKLLHGASTDEATYAQFLREVRAAAVVHGPCLVPVHHADVHGGVPYLVMEYVHGATLKQVLAHWGPLSLGVVLAVLKDMAEALDLLHRNGVIHRDLKPSNVLLGSDGRALVADFGLALRRNIVGPGASLSAPSGTPAYMAPELFEGQSSPRSDVYALGILVFELLAGKPPFEGDLGAVRAAHQSKPLPVEMLAARGIKADVLEVLERAANKKPMFRYKTASDFLRALEQAAKTEPARASDLGTLALGAIGEKPAEGGSRGAVAIADPGTPSTSYFDTIARLAEQKRGMHRRGQDEGQATGGAEADFPSLAYTEVPAVPVPPDAVGHDLHCLACGYNLLAVRRDGRCPECVRSVADTLAVEKALRDPAMLARLTAALGLLIAAVLLAWMPAGPANNRLAGNMGVQSAEWWVVPWSPLSGLMWLAAGAKGLVFAAPWYPLALALAGWRMPELAGLQLTPDGRGGRFRRKVTIACVIALAGAGLLMLAVGLGARALTIAVAPLLLPLAPILWNSFRGPMAVASVIGANGARTMMAIGRWLLTVGAGAVSALAWVWWWPDSSNAVAIQGPFRIMLRMPRTDTSADFAEALSAVTIGLSLIASGIAAIGLGLLLRRLRRMRRGAMAQVGP